MEIDKEEQAEIVLQPCPDHSSETLRHYCCDCSQSICDKCDHDVEHRTVPLDKVFEKQREIQERISAVQKQITSRIGELDESADSVKVAGNKSLVDMKTFFDNLRTALNDREKLLTEALTQSVDSKLAVISGEGQTLRRISEDIENGEQNLDKIDDLPNISSRLEEADLFVQKSRGQDHSDHSTLHPTYFAQIEQLLNKIGTVLNFSEAPTNVTASGEGLQYCCINRRACVVVETKNSKGTNVPVETSQVRGEILSQHGRVVCPVMVENTRCGTYNIFYELPREGLYQLSLSVHGNSMPGSPFSLRCISSDQYQMLSVQCALHGVTAVPVLKRRSHMSGGGKLSSSGGSRHSHTPIDDDLLLKVGEPGREKGQFTNIQGICSSESGQVIIADSNNQCVQIFNEDGQFAHRFGSTGRGLGGLQRPTGVAVAPAGHILVADYDNKWVNVFSSTGKFRSRFGSGRLLGPKGIAVTKQGTIIVVDNKANALMFFDSSGQFIKKMGSAARTAKFTFAGPHYVAVDDEERRIFVTDFHSHAVKVFGMEGRYLYQFGENGEGNGQFNAPTGIAVDRQHRVLVNDWGNGRIQIFDKNGAFIGVVNTSEALYGPQGLAVTPDDGNVLVADTGNHCYKLYRYFS